MRQRFIVTVLGAASVALAGCSSVDQVPLVYVSTVKVGVNVESGSAETPGAKLMIGFDATDAAYVPVAVARTCKGESLEMMKVCAKHLKDIAIITGRSEALTENDKSRIKQLADDANALSDKMVGTANSYSAALSREAKAQSDVSVAEEAKKEYDRLSAKRKDEGDAFSEAEQLDKAKLIADQLQMRKDASLAASDVVVAARETLNQDKDKLKNLTKEFLNLIPQQNGSSLGRSDALSVFGTFSGKVDGKAGADTGASLKLGKSFSTGVAAQSLSEGIANREKEAVKIRPECINAIVAGFDKLKPEEQNVKTLEKLISACE